jgi:hypothetical protein
MHCDIVLKDFRAADARPARARKHILNVYQLHFVAFWLVREGESGGDGV